MIAKSGLLALAACALALAPAHAERIDGAAPNYIFPDGSRGFALSRPGELEPCLFIGFSELPALGSPDAQLFLGDGSRPIVHLPPSASNSFTLVMAFNEGVNARLGQPPEPERTGDTSLSFTTVEGDRLHNFTLLLNIAGPGDVANWASFNPQPDPPGQWFGVKFGFAAVGDPDVTFSFFEDGEQEIFHLSTVPEPATWSLLIAGFGMTGTALRRRRVLAA